MNGAEDVPLDTTVSCRIDAGVQGLRAISTAISRDLIQVREGSRDGPRVAGATAFNLATRTVTFSPHAFLCAGTHHYVTLCQAGLLVSRGPCNQHAKSL
jgi:hypothetical protein